MADFKNLEICKDIYIADEALEILEKYFLGISPDLPMLIANGCVISLYDIKVSLQSDGKYRFNFRGPCLSLTEKNPGCDEYVIYLNDEPYGKNSSSI